MTRYGIYRRGSNAANQSGRERMLVAVVEAPNREAAEALESQSKPTIHDSRWLALDSSVDVWANQRVEAVPFSRVSARDAAELSEVRETKAALVEP